MKLFSLVGEFSVFFVYSISSPYSLKYEFYLPPLFSPIVIPFIHLKVKKQFEDTSDCLVSPRALASCLNQGTHPLNFYSDQKFESYINKSNLDWFIILALNLLTNTRRYIVISPNL